MADKAEQVVVDVPEGGDSPEYVAKMLARAEGQEAGKEENQVVEQKLEEKLFAGKYKSVEELEKAYEEAQKLIGSPKPEVKQPEEKQVTEQKQDTPQIADFSKYETEMIESGSLSDASIKEIVEQYKLPENIVKVYVEGFTALQERAVQATYDLVGGKDSWEAMSTWASNNVPKEQLEAVNTALRGNNPDLIKLMVKGLYADYKASNPKTPTLVKGNTTPVTSDSFQSWSQVKEAMANPKYASDPAYRMEVQDKMKRSRL